MNVIILFSMYNLKMFKTYLCRGTSETCRISSAGRASSPRDFVIIKNDKRMSSVCNQNRLESVSLEGNKNERK